MYYCKDDLVKRIYNTKLYYFSFSLSYFILLHLILILVNFITRYFLEILFLHVTISIHGFLLLGHVMVMGTPCCSVGPDHYKNTLHEWWNNLENKCLFLSLVKRKYIYYWACTTLSHIPLINFIISYKIIYVFIELVVILLLFSIVYNLILLINFSLFIK
jgi:hypothetical protein